jgi:tetratricopeptide (TPR) repeat protein
MKSRMFSIAAPLLCLLLLQSQPRQSGEIQSLYQKAREAEAQKNYGEAAGHYEQILKLDPALHPLRANLGLMRHLNGEDERAVNEFRKALAGDANLYAARLFLGISLLELNRANEALPHLEGAARDKPQDAIARFHLARAYYLTERHEEALKQLQALLEKQPGDAEALYLLGRVHLKLSLDAYEQLKRKHPEHYRIYQLLGENYEIQGLNGPAIVNYRKAIEANPKARGLRLKLGDLYQATGEQEKAIDAYRQELENNPGDAPAMYRLGTLLLDQKRLDEAAPWLSKSVTIDPNLAPARVSYGRCLLEKNQTQEAIAELRQAVKLDAESAQAWFQLARAYQKSGDAAAAQSALQMYEKFKDKQ